jgi:hypothetical protein
MQKEINIYQNIKKIYLNIFYCDDINEFYNYLSDSDNYRELLKFSKTFNKNSM